MSMSNTQVVKTPKRHKVKALPYLLLIPNMVLLGLFTFYPFIRSIVLSFCVTTPLGEIGRYVGTRMYEKVLTSPSFLNSLKVTMQYALMVGAGTVVLSMFFAMLCLEKRPGSRSYQTMFSLPVALASVPVCAIGLVIFRGDGFLNALIGTNTAWLSNKGTALMTCAIITIWNQVGMSFIFLLVGFRNVPVSLVECSKLDGANYLQCFTHVYVPIASPQIFYVIFLNIIASFKAFGAINVLTEGGPSESTNILIYSLYSNAFNRGRFETACVYAVVLCALIFLVTRIQMILEKRMVYYQ